MNSYIILLRGINVGGRNMLPMEDLKKLLSNNGFDNVRTYIQSGNVLARGTSATSEIISALIDSKFGFAPETLVLKEREFLESAKRNPFPSTNGKLVHFYFCTKIPALDKERITRLKADSEEYAILGRVFYLYAPDGIGRSKLVSNIESCLNTKATGRNLNTIKKLQELIMDA